MTGSAVTGVCGDGGSVVTGRGYVVTGGLW